MADIVISEFMDEQSVSDMLSGYDYLYDPALVDQSEKLNEALGHARAIIVRNRTQVRRDLLAAAPKLSVVGRLGVGLDNIDLDACEKRNISVFPATGANDLAVAEYVIAAAMMLMRGAYQSSEAVIAGGWPRNALIGSEVSGKRLGLVGFGAIARETARRAQALGMSVAAFDPYVKTDAGGVELLSFGALLETSDIISLHTPLNVETRHLIDAEAIDRMKPNACVINAARGGIVDDSALAEALRDGRLGGAALDVFETEPLDAQGGAVFTGLSNVLLTPHIAGVTRESNLRVSRLILEKVVNALNNG